MTKPSRNLAPLEDRVADEFRRLVTPAARCLIAVSGGADSMSLLDLLHRTRGRHGCALVVGHVDHGISPASGAVAQSVERAAAERQLACLRRNLDLGSAATETRARVARRAALKEMAAEADCRFIVLAQHADDQAETVLMRVIQGSGPLGLAAMAARRGRWIRPLLGIARDELRTYAVARALPLWDDPSNCDPAHLRSWVRRDVMPVLQKRRPDVVKLLGRGARQAATMRAAWNDVPALLPALDLRHEPRGISVAAPVLRGYRSPLRHAIVAALGRRCGVLLGVRRLRAVDHLLGSHVTGRSIDLARDTRAELAFGRLTLFKVEAIGDRELALDPGRVVQLGRATLQVDRAATGPVRRQEWSTALMPGRYVARNWRRGDRVSPLRGQGSRAVAVLLREAQVPVSQRATWPVVVCADDATIVWVPGICRADVAVPEEGTEAWRVECAFT